MIKGSECCDSNRAIGVRLVTHDTGSCRDALAEGFLRTLTQVYTRVPTKSGCPWVINPYKGSHASAHVSAHAVSPVRLSLVRFRPRERVGQGSRQAGDRMLCDSVAWM